MILYAIARRVGATGAEKLFDGTSWGDPRCAPLLYRDVKEARRELKECVPAKVRAASYVVRVRARTLEILDR